MYIEPGLFPEMLDYVKRCIMLSNARLSAEERSLLSVAYKSITGNIRSSWRTLTQLQQNEMGRATRREAFLLQKQREKIERELIDTCEDALKLLEMRLIPVAAPGDECVFYHKM